MEIQNKKIPEGEFMKLRQEVLTQWPTGQGVDLEDAFAFHKSLPQEKVFSQKLIAAKQQRKTLVQPRAGVPVIEEHVKQRLSRSQPWRIRLPSRGKQRAGSPPGPPWHP